MRRRSLPTTVALGLLVLISVLLATPRAAADASDVHLSVVTDRANYPAGEAVNITITFTNAGMTPVTLHFPSSCLSSFDISESEGRLRYTHRLHMECLAVLTDLTLGAEQSSSERFAWDQRGDDGAMLGTDGTILYTISAHSESYEAIGPATSTFTITGSLIQAPKLLDISAILLALVIGGGSIAVGFLVLGRPRHRRPRPRLR